MDQAAIERLKERLLSKCVEKPGPLDTPCLEFMGGRNWYGYGHIWINGGMQRTHRVSYELFIGPIPTGLWVLHRCDNVSCIRPDHLFIGDAQTNMDDKMAKGRHRCTPSPGEKNGNATLSERDAAEIKFLALEDQLTESEIAQMYSVSQSAIKHIKYGHNWSHVTPIAPLLPTPTLTASMIRRI